MPVSFGPEVWESDEAKNRIVNRIDSKTYFNFRAMCTNQIVIA